MTMPLTVLVVMDTCPGRQTVNGLALLMQTLKSIGLQAIASRDFEDALKTLQREEICTVICTLSIGDLTAFDFMAKANERNVRASMPFIVVTVSQTPVHDEVLSKACALSGATYLNLDHYNSGEDMQHALVNLIFSTCAQRACWEAAASPILG